VPQLAGLLGPSLFRFAQKLGLACGHCYPSLSRGAARLCGGFAACWTKKGAVD